MDFASFGNSFSQRAVLDAVIREAEAVTRPWCLGGRVVQYKLSSQQVDVQIARRVARLAPNGERDVDWHYENQPIIVNVPIMWLRAGNHAITIPIRALDSPEVTEGKKQPTFVLLLHAKMTPHGHAQTERSVGPAGTEENPYFPPFVAIPGWYPDTLDRFASIQPDTGEQRRLRLPERAMLFGDIVSTLVILIRNTEISLGPETVHGGQWDLPAAWVALAHLVERAIKNAIESHTHTADGTPTKTGMMVAPVESTAAERVKAR